MAINYNEIKIEWDNDSEMDVQFRVYISTQDFYSGALPETYVDLPLGVTEYTHTFTGNDEMVYFRVAAKYGNIINIADKYFEACSTVPSVIGEEVGGGYYVGNISVSGYDAGTYAVIVAPLSSQASLQWKTARTSTPLTTSDTNGKYNTLNMIAAGKAAHPAAAYCVDYDGDGFLDWYLPSRNELMLFYTNRASLAQAQLTASSHWSSTETNANLAYYQIPTSSSQSSTSKTDSSLVRPVRRIRIS